MSSPNPNSKAFSGKQKKFQLQKKRHEKREADKPEGVKTPDSTSPSPIKASSKGHRIKYVPGPLVPLIISRSLSSHWDVDGVQRLSPKENPLYQAPIQRINDRDWRKIDFGSFFDSGSELLDIPERPSWSFAESKEALEAKEQEYFKNWVEGVYNSAKVRSSLSYFEQNIEVWRQLWRVFEISDAIVIVADIRNPTMHLPPSFCKYIFGTWKKPITIALSKSDLVSGRLRAAWIRHIGARFPGAQVVPFSIYSISAAGSGKPKRYLHAFGVTEIISVLEEQAGHMYREQWDEIKISIQNRFSGADIKAKSTHHSNAEEEAGLFTFGFIGQPNAGKSSLINGIFGRKVVSTSRTPGHTKHFQTMHLTKNIRVCDCPGLVFPAILDKNIQILAGLYNIAQVSDPYSPLLYLAKRVDLMQQLNLPSAKESPSIFDICELYAEKLGFYTGKAGRPDIYRAASIILRLQLDGKILLNYCPLDYEIDVDDEMTGALLDADNVYSEGEEGSDEDDESEPEQRTMQGNAFQLLSIDDY